MKKMRIVSSGNQQTVYGGTQKPTSWRQGEEWLLHMFLLSLYVNSVFSPKSQMFQLFLACCLEVAVMTNCEIVTQANVPKR